MIHVTHPDRVGSILEAGLLTGQTPELTGDAAWTLNYYEVNPVFLGKPDSDFITALREGPWADHAVIEVDIAGLELVADLACLIDKGARHDEDGYLYWTPSRIPPAMRLYLDNDGAIGIEHLLDPRTDACKAAVALTGTAACLQGIPPARLTLAAPMQAMAP